jgi:hypothetical protein
MGLPGPLMLLAISGDLIQVDHSTTTDQKGATSMAGMRCSICGHPQRQLLDRLLVGGNTSVRSIAGRFGLAKTSLLRHRDSHLMRAVQRQLQRREKEDDALANLFDERLEDAHAAVRRALQRAEASDEGLRLIAPLVGQLHRNAELLGRASGRLDGEGSGRGGGGVRVENLIILPRAFDPSPNTAADDAIDVTALDVTSTRDR